MGIRDTYPILARKTQLGGPAPRKYTINADEFDLLVDLIDELSGADATATADLAGVGHLLWEMPMSTGAVGTPVYIRTAGDAPSAPTGSGSAAVGTAKSLASAAALSLTATERGGWLWPLAHGLTLPTDGYVIDMLIAALDESGNNYSAMLVPGADVASPLVRGLALEFYPGATNTNLRTIDLESSDYCRPSADLGASLPGWPSAPSASVLQRGPLRLRLTWRKVRVDGSTTRWRLQVETWSPDGTYTYSAFASSVATPTSTLNGLYLATPMVGVWIDAASDYDSRIDIERLRIFSLP